MILGGVDRASRKKNEFKGLVFSNGYNLGDLAVPPRKIKKTSFAGLELQRDDVGRAVDCAPSTNKNLQEGLYKYM